MNTTLPTPSPLTITLDQFSEIDTNKYGEFEIHGVTIKKDPFVDPCELWYSVIFNDDFTKSIRANGGGIHIDTEVKQYNFKTSGQVYNHIMGIIVEIQEELIKDYSH